MSNAATACTHPLRDPAPMTNMERPTSVSDRVLTSGRRLKMGLSSLKSIEIRETTAALRIQQFYRKYLVKCSRPLVVRPPASSKKLKVTNDTLALTTAFFTSTMASTKQLHAREMLHKPTLIDDHAAIAHVDLKAAEPALLSAAMKELAALRSSSPSEADVTDADLLVHDQFVNMMHEKWLLCSTAERQHIHEPSTEPKLPFYATVCDVRPWFSDLVFVARGGPTEPHVREVMTGPSSVKHLRGIIDAISALNGTEQWAPDASALVPKIRKLFWTMRSEMILPMVRSIGYILCKGWRLLFDGLYIDAASITMLQELVARLGPDVSLVFTPTHKSHLDYLIVSFVCFAYGLPLPRIAAGNNLNLPLVGRYLRANGSFFIRRSFQGDTLYKEVLTSYVHQLLVDGAPLEVFVEGGRSRHGRVLSPKFGFFHMIASYLEAHPHKAVVVVPLSIDYDKVLEVPDYVAQLLGTPKQKESIWNLLKSVVSLLFNRCGFCYVRLGAPITMQAGASMEQLGASVVRRMQTAGTITSTCLVATILLASRDEPLTRSQLEAQVRWLQATLVTRDATLAPFSSLETLLDHALRLLDLPLTAPFLPTPLDASCMLRLAYYRNHLLHHFVPDMCLATLLASYTSSTFTLRDVTRDLALPWALCKRLCPGASVQSLETSQMQAFLGSVPIHVLRDGVYSVDTTAYAKDPLVHLATSLLWPFMDAVALVLRALETHIAPLNDKHLGKRHQFSERHVITWIHKETPLGAVDHDEAMSMENIKVALHALVDSHVVLNDARVFELAPAYASLASLSTLRRSLLRKPRRQRWHVPAASEPRAVSWGHLALLLL
ncbi:hypothetical protein SDRG_08295 [Saprolegnia diclina VS20]|uniref:Phospholipid/glycerol acyltransferase domain-containing protein n=1 Tax=Saprolegnia diclina (strain VS20) TaxID=1156394 RepID=T0Q892_SAPDV|nr:hypothetical protein SDRG_08295 [Saprolegnia diclina VS20]EQC34084.1 hypothetical protein SDRG_08295 [Saprolegnia diclina VS20]|eukprot:XP_008612396.1 hypothetical protein SDRG_08295 [Saprolegnia diclina VS20]